MLVRAFSKHLHALQYRSIPIQRYASCPTCFSQGGHGGCGQGVSDCFPIYLPWALLRALRSLASQHPVRKSGIRSPQELGISASYIPPLGFPAGPQELGKPIE